MDLLSNILVSGIFQIGLLNGHNPSLYTNLENIELLNANYTTIVDYQLNIYFKYGFIKGGFASYSIPTKIDISNQYPYREDFNFELGLKYKNFELSYYHICNHAIDGDILAMGMKNGDVWTSSKMVSSIIKIGIAYSDIFKLNYNTKTYNLNKYIDINGNILIGYSPKKCLLIGTEDYRDSYHIVKIEETKFINIKLSSTILNYFFVNGTFVNYDLLKSYYNYELGLKYKNYKIGFSKDNYNPIAKNTIIKELPNIDKSYYKLFLEININNLKTK